MHPDRLFLLLNSSIIPYEVLQMNTVDFEIAFGDFLERQEYDDVESRIFSLVRAAFRAGWDAAGGVPPRAEPVIRLVDRPRDRD